MEVSVRIRFTTPCLAGVRQEPRNVMLRNAEKKVIFLQSWWRAVLRYGAQAMSKYGSEVDKVQADPEVEGQLGIYRRFYNAASYTEHEAYLAGDELLVHFCLPPGLTTEAFFELMNLAGRYVGISPYKPGEDFGRFVVLEVKKRENSHTHSIRQPDPGSARTQGIIDPAPDVPKAGAGRQQRA